MRDPRLTPLVVAAHGSADPQFDGVVRAIEVRVRGLRPALDVRVGYLDHGPPTIDDVVDDDCVVVPLFLTSGYHVRVDLPVRAAGAVVAAAVGPDPMLAAVLVDRLGEAGYDGQVPVVLAAAGSSDDSALADVRLMARQLAARLDTEVTAAYLSGGTPRLDDLRPTAVASYLLAPGAFHDAARRCGAGIVSAPIGDHPIVADLVLARYDAAQVPGRTAPA